MNYDDLSDEQLVEIAIDFLASEQPLPDKVVDRLKELGLYKNLTNIK